MVNLVHGVVPISKAASSLAQLLRLAGTEKCPVVITQKGYPSGVLMTIEQFQSLRDQARGPARVQGSSIQEEESASV